MSQMKGSKNVSKMAFFLLPLGIAVNFIGGQVATLLNLPIYLDAIGTMVVAALCGPIYSVATALVTGLLMSITHPTNLVYIGNYLAVGLFSGLFAYWGFYKNVWKSCIAGAVVGLFWAATAPASAASSPPSLPRLSRCPSRWPTCFPKFPPIFWTRSPLPSSPICLCSAFPTSSF